VGYDGALQRLTRIETKLDAVLEIDRDHEHRLRSVENKQWWMSRAAAVIGLLGSYFGHNFKVWRLRYV